MSRRAVFLDRDGTVNVRAPEHEYIVSATDFCWLDGAREAIRRFIELGYFVAIVSNQRGVGRGLVQVSTLQEIEAVMQADLRRLGCSVDAFRYCIHLQADECSCRKPAPGMILELAAEFALDLGNSWMVGDAESDVQAGRAAGCRTALIGERPIKSAADIVVRSLREFADALATTPDQSALRTV